MNLNVFEARHIIYVAVRFSCIDRSTESRFLRCRVVGETINPDISEARLIAEDHGPQIPVTTRTL